MALTDWLQLRNRRGLVVGAGGLGGVCALALAQAGARILVVDVDRGKLESVRLAAKEAGADLEVAVADLADPQTCREVVDEAVRRLGRLDIFLHAVGTNLRLPILEYDDDTWSRLLTLNLSTAFWTGQAVGRTMYGQRYGRMIFISSVSSRVAHLHHGPYAATKGGLNQLLRVMAREWMPHNVTVNAVAPGYIETELTQDYLAKDGNRERLTALVPAERLGRAEEVADAVTFLASDRAAFVTGQCLFVDGGRTLV